jgi:hypothetical protein
MLSNHIDSIAHTLKKTGLKEACLQAITVEITDWLIALFENVEVSYQEDYNIKDLIQRFVYEDNTLHERAYMDVCDAIDRAFTSEKQKQVIADEMHVRYPELLAPDIFYSSDDRLYSYAWWFINQKDRNPANYEMETDIAQRLYVWMRTVNNKKSTDLTN